MARPNLNVEIAGIKLKNPVLPASGTFGFGEEYAKYLDINSLGAVVVKSVTLNPTMGNPPPRICETAAGMLNSIGWQNPGLKVFLEEKLPFLTKFDVPVLVNLAGKTMEEYVRLAEIFEETKGISGLELNISCPNVEEGGAAFGASAHMVSQVTAAVRQKTKLPLIVKLSPNVTDITETALAAEESGADAVSLINTLTGMAIDADSQRPILGKITGGLSGPAVKPVALYMVWRVAQAVRIPVIGMGGIMTATDALEFLLAGATAVAVGIANFVNPLVMEEIIGGIEDYLLKKGYHDIKEIIGALKI